MLEEQLEQTNVLLRSILEALEVKNEETPSAGEGATLDALLDDVMAAAPALEKATYADTELDSNGVAYDPEYHALNRAQNKAGEWKKRRGGPKAAPAPVGRQETAAPDTPSNGAGEHPPIPSSSFHAKTPSRPDISQDPIASELVGHAANSRTAELVREIWNANVLADRVLTAEDSPTAGFARDLRRIIMGADFSPEERQVFLDVVRQRIQDAEANGEI